MAMYELISLFVYTKANQCTSIVVVGSPTNDGVLAHNQKQEEEEEEEDGEKIVNLIGPLFLNAALCRYQQPCSSPHRPTSKQTSSQPHRQHTFAVPIEDKDSVKQSGTLQRGS